MDNKHSLLSDLYYQIHTAKKLAIEPNESRVYKDNASHFSPLLRDEHQLAGWDKALFRRFLKSRQDSTPLPKPTDNEDIPTWMQNRKLLVRVFVIWIMLAGYMLLNVLSNKNF